MKEVSPYKLTGHDRALARLAWIARHDVIWGGARAMVLANRLKGDFQDVVSEAYTSVTGTAENYIAYECNECGQAHLGKDNALRCCQYDDDCNYDEQLIDCPNQSKQVAAATTLYNKVYVMSFIEVTLVGGGIVLVKTKSIEMVYSQDNGDKCLIVTKKDVRLVVAEPYEDIKARIRSVICG